MEKLAFCFFLEHTTYILLIKKKNLQCWVNILFASLSQSAQSPLFVSKLILEVVWWAPSQIKRVLLTVILWTVLSIICEQELSYQKFFWLFFVNRDSVSFLERWKRSSLSSTCIAYYLCVVVLWLSVTVDWCFQFCDSVVVLFFSAVCASLTQFCDEWGFGADILAAVLFVIPWMRVSTNGPYPQRHQLFSYCATPVHARVVSRSDFCCKCFYSNQKENDDSTN